MMLTLLHDVAKYCIDIYCCACVNFSVVQIHVGSLAQLNKAANKKKIVVQMYVVPPKNKFR